MSKTPPRRKKDQRISQFVSAVEDAENAERAPATAQTATSAYRLAFEDRDFLRSDPLRGVRLQLELEKAEAILRDNAVRSTVIMFGGARIPTPGQPARGATAVARESLESLTHFYEEARRFARIVSEHSLAVGGGDYVIATGGGPGIMEAGNRGAADAGAPSIGFHISLPNEEAPNAYVETRLCFNFHYFAIRKMHFLMRAHAIAVFPGGFGTLDELFEVLTLIQMKRMKAVPIVLFGEAYWRRIINFEALRDSGTIAPQDLDLFAFVETADAAWAHIQEWIEKAQSEA